MISTQKIVARYSLVLWAALMALMALSPLAQAQEKMGIQPADSDYFYFELEPGETVEAAVVVNNNAAFDQTVGISGIDALATDGGFFALEALDESEDYVGKWIEVESDTITVEAFGRETISFSLTIPEVVEPGDYAGGLLIYSVASSVKDDSTLGGEGEAVVGVKTLTQIGTRVYVSVKGDLIFDLDWNDYNQEVLATGEHVFGYDFKNNGNVNVGLSANLEIQNTPFSMVEVPLDLGTVMARASSTPTYIWENPPPLARVVATTNVDYARVSLFSVGETDEMKDSFEPQIISYWIIPWLEIAIALGAGFLVFAFFGYRSYRKSAFKKQCQKVVWPIDESLMTIATRASVNWKMLAKVNKIKAPFMVMHGQEIWAPSSAAPQQPQAAPQQPQAAPQQPQAAPQQPQAAPQQPQAAPQQPQAAPQQPQAAPQQPQAAPQQPQAAPQQPQAAPQQPQAAPQQPQAAPQQPQAAPQQPQAAPQQPQAAPQQPQAAPQQPQAAPQQPQANASSDSEGGGGSLFNLKS